MIKYLGFRFYLLIIGLILIGTNWSLSRIIPDTYPNTCTLFEIPVSVVMGQATDPCQGTDYTAMYNIAYVLGLALMIVGAMLSIIRIIQRSKQDNLYRGGKK